MLKSISKIWLTSPKNRGNMALTGENHQIKNGENRKKCEESLKLVSKTAKAESFFARGETDFRTESSSSYQMR